MNSQLLEIHSTNQIFDLLSRFLPGSRIVQNEVRVTNLVRDRKLGSLPRLHFLSCPTPLSGQPLFPFGLRHVNEHNGITHLGPSRLQHDRCIENHKSSFQRALCFLYFLSNAALDIREYQLFERPQLCGVGKDDPTQLSAIDGSTLIQDDGAKAVHNTFNQGRLPQRLMAQLIGGNQVSAPALQEGADTALPASHSADQANHTLSPGHPIVACAHA
jgi:hypothetical protein